MAVSYEYITYPGNGDVIANVFNAIATLSGSTMMAGAAQAASLFGFIVVLSMWAFKLDMRESLSWLIGVFIIWMVLMTPKVTVLVSEQSGYGFSAKQQAVGNVPFGLAATSSIISQFGLNLTRKMEQVYSVPTDLQYTRSGLMFGNKLYEGIYDSKYSDDVLISDWALFTHNCSFFDVNMYKLYTINELKYTNNILALIGRTNNALFTNVTDVVSTNTTTGLNTYATTSTTYSCKAAYALLKDRTLKMNNHTATKLANKIFNYNGMTNVPSKLASLQAVGNSSMQFLLNDARFDTMKAIEQTAMMDMLRRADMINYQRTNNGAAAQQAFSLAMAKSQYISSQKTGAMMASWNLPLVRSTAEAILLGIFPLVILGALLGGAMAFKSLMFYLGGLLWIQLWAPVASILNLVMAIHTRKIMSAEAAMSATGNITAGTQYEIMQAAVDAQSAAGAAFWLIPVVAGAVAFGGRSIMTSMMGMVTGGKSQSEAAGSQAGAGNYNYGNMSVNSASGNKFQTDPVYNSPNMVTTNSTAGAKFTDSSTGNSRYQSRDDKMPRMSVSSGASMAESFTQQAERSMQSANSMAAQASNSVAVGDSQTMTWAMNHASTASASNGYGMNLSAAESQQVSQVMSAADKLAQSNKAGTASQYASILAMSLGTNSVGGVKQSDEASTRNTQQATISQSTGSGGQGITGGTSKQASQGSSLSKVKQLMGQVGLQSDHRVQNSDSLASEIAQSVETLRSQGVKFDQSTVDNITKSEAFQSAVSSGDSLATGAVASYQQAQQAMLSSNQSYQEAEGYREQASAAIGRNASVNLDGAADVAQYADREGLTMQDIYQQPGSAVSAAMGSAAGNAAVINQAASGTAFAANTDLTPNQRPQNTVKAAHESNVADLSGQYEAKAQNVVAQSGVNTSAIDSRIQASEGGLAQDYTTARGNAAAGIQSGKNDYGQTVDQLGKYTKQMGDQVETIGMRLNSQQTSLNTEEAQAKVRSGEGSMGSGYDAVFSHMVDNKNLASNMKSEGSQTSMFEKGGNNRSSGSMTFPKD